jgi:GT2 family glycosyltransferase
LERCLVSVRSRGCKLVYVDSGSSDGSPARARALGADVIELDSSASHTAARGRNAGIEFLAQADPSIRLVQVVDGDCELDSDWIDAARAFLDGHPEVAVVCGRRRERYPHASLWNQLADVEWDGSPGEVESCGGDAMIRVDAWRRAGGYDSTLIAGEDPELCWRIRRSGGRIVRLDREMTLHDAALLRAGQWWRRQTRSGHAYAETTWRHRPAPDPARLRRLASLLFWGGAWPSLCLGFAGPTQGASLLGLLAWAWPWHSAYRGVRRRWPARTAALWATACLLGKIAETQGALVFAANRLVRRRTTRLIEYKGAGS